MVMMVVTSGVVLTTAVLVLFMVLLWHFYSKILTKSMVSGILLFSLQIKKLLENYNIIQVDGPLV